MESVEPGFHNSSGVDSLMSSKDKLISSSHSAGCKSVSVLDQVIQLPEICTNSVCFRPLSVCQIGCKKSILSKYIK